MEIKDFLEMQSDRARKLCSMADWYHDHLSPTLSEYVRYGQRVVCDFIDTVRAECKTLDDVENVIELMRYDVFNRSSHYRSLELTHFVELAAVKDAILGEILADINRNK